MNTYIRKISVVFMLMISPHINSSGQNSNPWIVPNYNLQIQKEMSERRDRFNQEMDQIADDKRKSQIATVQNRYYSFQSYPSYMPYGWYNVTITDNSRLITDIKVYVEDNMIISYTDDDWNIVKLNKPGSIYLAKGLMTYRDSNNVEVLFIDYLSNPDIKVSPPLESGSIGFYIVSEKKAPIASIYVDGEYLGEIKYYRKYSKKDPLKIPISCKDNIVSVVKYKVGTYKYTVSSNKGNWSGTITIDYLDCNLIRLNY